MISAAGVYTACALYSYVSFTMVAHTGSVFVVEPHQQTKFGFLKTCHSVTVSTYSVRLFLSAADGDLVYIYNFCHTCYVNSEVIFHLLMTHKY